MADNVEIQGLEFQIVGNASEANQGLKALTSTLKKLQSVTSKGLGLTAVANDVRQFNEDGHHRHYLYGRCYPHHWQFEPYALDCSWTFTGNLRYGL